MISNHGSVATVTATILSHRKLIRNRFPPPSSKFDHGRILPVIVQFFSNFLRIHERKLTAGGPTREGRGVRLKAGKLDLSPLLSALFWSQARGSLARKKRKKKAENKGKTSGKRVSIEPQTSPKQAANKGETTMQLTEQYRPRTWDDVAGQDKIIQRIKGLAKRGLAGRAYWLSPAANVTASSLRTAGRWRFRSRPSRTRLQTFEAHPAGAGFLALFERFRRSPRQRARRRREFLTSEPNRSWRECPREAPPAMSATRQRGGPIPGRTARKRQAPRENRSRLGFHQAKRLRATGCNPA